MSDPVCVAVQETFDLINGYRKSHVGEVGKLTPKKSVEKKEKEKEKEGVTKRLASVTRMVVGHTPQAGGVQSDCAGKIWTVDVGMSRGMLRGIPQVRRSSYII